MKNIDDFKSFVKTKPELISYVKNDEMTWQKFYDMWYLYGEDTNVWGKYKQKDTDTASTKTKSDSFGFNDILNMFKKMDMETVRKNVTSLQKAIGLVQEMTTKGASTAAETIATKAPYTPRPMFRRFED